MVEMFLGRSVLHTPLDHTQQKRIIILGFMVWVFIPYGMFWGRMQYAPTRVHVFDRWMVRAFSGRGVLHTSIYHARQKQTIIFRFLGYPFIPYGMIVGRMQYAPTTVHVFDRWMVGMFSGSGVLHTTLYHSQQKRTIIWEFMAYPFIPCGMFVGRMQYAPTTVHVFDRWMVEMFSGRGALHTSLYRPRRGRIIIWRFMGYTFISCGMIVGRMQYAPTRVRVFDRWMVGMFSGRGVLHTPLYHAQQKWVIIWEFMVAVFIPYGMIVGRMQYAPTWVHVFYRCVVRVFSGRVVLHTSLYRPRRGRRII